MSSVSNSSNSGFINNKNTFENTSNNSNSKSKSKSKLQTSKEFDAEGDEYTKNALRELEQQMKDTPVNTNINVKTQNYNLRQRKNIKNRKNHKNTMLRNVDETIYILNTDDEEDLNDSDIEVNQDCHNMLIANAKNALNSQKSSNYKRRRDNTFANLTDNDVDVNMTKLMMGQRELELQKNINLIEANSELKTELKSNQIQLHYMKLDLVSTQATLAETKDELIMIKKNNELILKDKKDSELDIIFYKVLSYILFAFIIYLYLQNIFNY